MIAIVLVAESDPFQLRLLQEVCEAAGHDVVTAADASAALEVVARHRPDLVLLDVDLAMDGVDQGGLEALRVLRDEPRLAEVPVIATTAAADDAGRRAALAAGAEDFLVRPFRVFEVEQRVRNALRRALAERRLLALRTEPGIDPLTRGGSAAQLPITLEYEHVRAARYAHPLSCISVRLAGDDPRADAASRDAADARIAELAGALRGCVRGIDHLFRGRGDEVVLVLPETSATDAGTVVARLVERRRRGQLPAIEGCALEAGIAGRPEAVFSDGAAMLAAARAARRSIDG